MDLCLWTRACGGSFSNCWAVTLNIDEGFVRIYEMGFWILSDEFFCYFNDSFSIFWWFLPFFYLPKYSPLLISIQLFPSIFPVLTFTSTKTCIPAEFPFLYILFLVRANYIFCKPTFKSFLALIINTLQKLSFISFKKSSHSKNHLIQKYEIK